jgi:hypothetical protein
LEKDEIDAFSEKNDGLIFHETKFNEVLSAFINTQLYFYLCFSEKNKLVGICPIHKSRNGLLADYYTGKLDYEIPYGGWVFSDDIGQEVLIEQLRPGFFESYQYFSNIFRCGEKAEDYRAQNRLIYWTSLIDLNNSTEVIWKDYIDPKKRNKIRKAQKNDIEIVFAGTEAISTFYSLLIEMNKATGMKSKDLEFYKELLKNYSNGKSKIIFAYHKKKLLSGLLLLGNKNIMHYWQGATAMNSGNFGQGELLQWEAIKWSADHGIKFYDLCYLYSDKQLEQKAEKQMRIAEFKLGFSKELAFFFNTHQKSTSYSIIHKVKRILSTS